MKSEATIFHRPSGYYLWYYDLKGRRKAVSCRTQSKSEAKLFRDQFVKGVSPTSKRNAPITLKGFRDEYIADCKSRCTPKTVHNAESCFREFIKFLKSDAIPIRALSVKQCQDFVNAKQTNTSVATAIRHYTVLKAAFNDAITWGYLAENSFSKVKRPKVIKKHKAWISLPEFQKFAEYILHHGLLPDHSAELNNSNLPAREEEIIENRRTLFQLILVDYVTGLRSGEIRHLQFEHIDWEKRTLSVVNTSEFTSKSKEPRTIPLPDLAFLALSVMKNRSKTAKGLVFPILYYGAVKMMQEGYLAHNFKKWIIAAKMNPSLNFHSLRHSYASVMSSVNVPMPFIQRVMGHRNMQTTMDNYIHLQQDGLRDSVNVFNKLNEPKTTEGVDTTDDVLE